MNERHFTLEYRVGVLMTPTSLSLSKDGHMWCIAAALLSLTAAGPAIVKKIVVKIVFLPL